MNPIIKNKWYEVLFILLLFLVLPLLKTDKTLDPELHIQFLALSLILLFYWLILLIKRKSIIINTKSVLYFTIVYFSFLIYSLFSLATSNNTADSIFNYTKLLLYFFLLGSFAFFIDIENHYSTLSHTINILMIIILMTGYSQLFSLVGVKKLIIPLSTYHIHSIFPHRNLFSEIVLLLLPFSICSWFEEKNLWRLLGIINYSLALLLLIILSNRATWIASIFTGIVISGISFSIEKKIHHNKPIIYFSINTLLVILLGVFMLLHYSDPSTLKKHTLNTVDFNEGSTKDRLELWERTTKLIAEKPILGVGFGSWKINMLKYGNEGLISENNTTFYQRPHNDFLWVMSEQGLIGAVFYGMFFFLVILYTIGLLRKSKDKTLKNKLLVIVSITISYLVFSMFSFPRERIVQNSILFSIWGVFLNLLNSLNKQNSKSLFSFKGIFIIPILLSGITLVGVYRLKGEIHTKEAILAKKAGNYKKCIRETEKGKSVFYRMDETSTPLDWYTGLSYYKMDDYSNALSYFQMACHLNPYHIYVLNDYGSCLAKLNQEEKAIELYRKAISISKNFPEARLNLCALYFNANKIPEAFDILKGIDTDTDAERYKKTVILILRRIIEKYLSVKQPNTNFLNLYHKEFSNYSFYHQLLKCAISNNLQPDEIIKTCQNNNE